MQQQVDEEQELTNRINNISKYLSNSNDFAIANLESAILEIELNKKKQ